MEAHARRGSQILNRKSIVELAEELRWCRSVWHEQLGDGRRLRLGREIRRSALKGSAGRRLERGVTRRKSRAGCVHLGSLAQRWHKGCLCISTW